MSGATSSPIPANWRIPLFYARFSPTNANPGQVSQRTLLLGQSALSAPSQPTPVYSAAQAQGLFGPNSQLARMTADYFANDPTATLLALPLAAAGGAVAASCTITFTGTVGSAWTLALYIAGDSVPVPLAAGASATAAATATAAAVNAAIGCAMSATAASGVVTLTAETPGAAGNQIDVRLNYLGMANGESTPPGLTVTIGAVTGGSGDPVLTGVDAILGDANYDFIVSPYSLSAQTTALSAMLNNVSGRWSVTRQSYGHVFAARNDSNANLLALGGALNDPHTTMLGTQLSPTPPWRAAAMFAGAAAASLRNLPTQPLQTLPLVGFLPPAQGDRLPANAVNALLNAGIATLGYASDNTASISRAVTTYQLNSFGIPDQSYLDTETPFTLMAITRRLMARFTSRYPRAILVQDGTRVGPLPGGVRVISPKIALAEIAAEYTLMQTDGLVDNAPGMLAATTCSISTTDPSRLEVYWVPNLVSGLRIIDLTNAFSLLAPAA